MRVGELKRRWKLLAAAALLAAFAAGCGAPGSAVTAADEAGADAAAGTRTEAAAERETGQDADGLAGDSETASPLDVVEDGMTPVYADELADGVYPVEVDSSSSMFKITDCSLTVSDGQMEAVMTMGGKGYLKVFMGTGEEALKASEDEFIPYEEMIPAPTPSASRWRPWTWGSTAAHSVKIRKNGTTASWYSAPIPCRPAHFYRAAR